MGFDSQEGLTVRRDDTDSRPSSVRACFERLAPRKWARPPQLIAALILAPLVVALALSGAAGIGHAADAGDSAGESRPAAPTMPPSGVSADWWRDVQRGFAEAEYHPSHSAKGLQAPNRAHNLRTYFGPTGIRLHDRTAAGAPRLAGLSLTGLGRGEALSPVAAGVVDRSGKRVEIRRPGIVEWYENSAKGLEQGFTLATRAKGDGALVLELAVAHARARLIGKSIELATDSGRRLRYGKLKVEDATGRILVSRLEAPTPDRLRLVVDDAGAHYPVVIDPLVTGVPDAFLESNQPGSSGIKPAGFGRSVAGAGDVNGDGFADVIVGAWGWDGGQNEEGAAFVFLGSLNGIVGTNPASAFARIESNNAAARLGWSVSGAGDVNGDGFDDVVVGSYLYRSAVDFPGFGLGTVQGAAFVYLGGATGIQGADDPALANARIISNEIDSFLGYSVSGAGDVNGDGFADIIVGGPRAGIPFLNPDIPPYDRQGNGGVALVFLGSLAGITGTGFEDAHKELRPYPLGLPEILGGGMGESVSGAGDVNGDGFDDIIVGMPGSGGSAIVFLGSAAGIVGDDPSTAHANIFSDTVTPLGESVSGAGDVNADGFADIILGAPRSPIPPLGFSPDLKGAFLVFHGSAQGITAATAADAQAAIQGTIRLQHLGWEVSAAGDVDGDGFSDVIAGALNYAGGLNTEGAAYVFRGGPLGIAGTSLPDDAYVRLESQQSGAAINLVDIALSAAGIGDVDGDGFADVMLGTGFYDNGEVNEGAAFVFHGGAAPAVRNQPPVTLAGADQSVLDVDNSGSETITVDGRLSVDAEAAIAGYAWFEGEALLGTSPVLTTSLTTTGRHTLVLTVTDAAGVTRGDPVDIFVGLVDQPFVSFEDFSSGGFAGGIGAWLGAWTVAGDVTLSADNFPSPPQARVGPNATLSRAATLPVGTTGMMLQFDAKVSQFATSDRVAVEVSHDGGATFTGLRTFTVDDSDGLYRFYGGSVGEGRVTLSWYPATATELVLRFASTAAIGALFVDDIQVTALQVPAGTPLPLTVEPPVANAGVDMTVDDLDNDGFHSVILDGSLSTDFDGTIVSYQWHEVTSGGTFPLGNGANSVTLPVTLPVGSHTVQLIVTDDAGASARDTAAITVNPGMGTNQPPVANAGPDQTILDSNGDTLEVVSFDGSASTDPDGTIVSYIWTKNGTMFGNTPTFSVNQPVGVHTVELTVTDDQGATSTDTVVVTVVANDTSVIIDSFAATPTLITAGESTTLSWLTTGADSVSINGGASLLPDGSISVSPTTNTVYTMSATGTGGTAIRSVTVGVNQPPPVQPTVDIFAATPTTITAGETVTLSWTTTDADNVSIDNGVGAVAVDGNVIVSPTVTTTYALTATSGTGGTATSGLTITVNSDAPASSEALTITQFEFRAGKSEWRIGGTSSIPGPGNTMTLYTGPTAPGAVMLGTASVDSLGIWNFREKNSSVAPDSTGTISIVSSQGGKWEAISGTGLATPSGDPAPPPAAPVVDSFSAALATITAGEAATLTWTTTNADSVSINGGPNQAADGTSSVSPTTTTSYTLTATGAGGSATASVTVTVNPAPPPGPPTVDSFSAAPATITAGDAATLTWTSTNADSVSINGGAILLADGSSSVTPTATTVYTLTATGASGTATASVTVTVNPAPPPAPVVDGFTATPATITAGDAATLTWTTTNADSVSINGGAILLADGSNSVTPTATTTYTLTATGAGGTATASVTVTVNAAGTLPTGAVGLAGLASVNRGDDVSWTVTLTNTGTATLTGVQLSLGVSPASLVKSLSPGGTVSVVDVAPGGSVSQTWNGRADNEGSGTLTAEAFSAGTSLDLATQALTVIK